MYAHITDFIHQTSWPLLQVQKLHLLELAERVSTADEEVILGIVSWIDNMQDLVVDAGHLTALEVFGDLGE